MAKQQNWCWSSSNPPEWRQWDQWFGQSKSLVPEITSPWNLGTKLFEDRCWNQGVLYVIITSSTAQGGGGSFKNRKPIGEIGCCESGMAEQIHWWTERCLKSPLFLSLSLTIYLPTYLSSMYLSIYRSFYLSLFHLITYLSICLSIYLSIFLSLYISLSSVYLSSCLPVYLSIYLSVYLSTCLSVVQCHSVYCSVVSCSIV